MKIRKVVIVWLLILGTVLAVLPAIAIAQEWKVPITFISGNTKIKLEFGTNVSATRGFDEEIDLPLPPLGMGQKKYAYFNISEYEKNEDVQKLYKDYRPLINQSNSEEVWKLHLKSDEKIHLKWDTSNVPCLITLTMKIGSKTIDMKQESSYTLEAGEYVIYITACYNVSDRIPPKIYNIRPIEDIYTPLYP